MHFLSLLALVPLIAANPVARNNDSPVSLSKARNKYFGTAYQSFYPADGRFLPVLESQFNQYTPENELKWEVVQPQRGVFNWTGADLIFAEAKKTGAIVRGHTLVWHSQLPMWVQNITDASDLKSVMKTHIDAVMGRYGSQMAHIDVVNEPLNENGTWRNSVWYNLLGEEFPRIALDYAHAAAPQVKLYINDYNIESINNKSLAHAAIAKKLLSQGAPLTGYGFQAHFIGGSAPNDTAQAMKMFTDMGLEVAITELDVRVPVNNRARLIRSRDYANAFKVCIDNPKCPGVTIWGVSDETSWVPGVFAGTGSALLFDFDYKPKQAYYAVQNVLKQ
ncbi:xylanase [Dioszegia hungarica]|uniref:Beta-xylanase n=1 Tax=Dioszegia hungarica TaxID=4972 RepID=A0AA38H1S4_9TREE|nr:xylanase [Dioszegia hungarica]KAI9632470.1 xylanase [Dioszegia hungarica]